MNSIKKTEKKDSTEPDPLQLEIIKLKVSEQQIAAHWQSILREIVQPPEKKK